MPVGPTKTKAQKQAVVHTEMSKFKDGNLHSGSKKGPVVTNPKQAIAISLSESKQSKQSKPKASPVGQGESEKNYDRSAHFKGNPGFPSHPEGSNMGYGEKEVAYTGSENRGSDLNGECGEGHVKQSGGKGLGFHNSAKGAEHHKGHGMGGAPHNFPQGNGAHSYGHGAHVRSGNLRLSGHANAHQVGKRK